MSRFYYLKRNIVIEPLIARYYASPYLVSPCSAPRFFSYLVKKLLFSFSRAPEQHELILQNSRMQGGPFVSLPSKCLLEVKNLLDKLQKNLKDLFAIADAQQTLWQLLATAQGENLETWVDKIPIPLQGVTELFYERSGRASYRIDEALFYHTKAYAVELQEILLYPLLNDKRDFVLTTPRLEKDNHLFIKIQHDSEILDKLVQTRFDPIQDIYPLANALGLVEKDYVLFSSFFECAIEPTRRREDDRSSGLNGIMKTRYWGHACVEITTESATIFLDPLVAYEFPELTDRRLTLFDLPEWIDVIVITHLHLDHFCIETLLQLRSRVGRVIIAKAKGGTPIDPSPKWILHQLGFKTVIELDSTECYRVGDMTITAFPFFGEHGCLDITSKSIFKVSNGQTNLIFAADVRTTDNALLVHIAKLCGPVDYLYMGMESEGAPLSWIYGPLLDEPIDRKWDQSRRLNGSNAVLGLKLVQAFKPKKVNIYALGREPWLSHLMKVDCNESSPTQKEINCFSEQCKQQGIAVEILFMCSIDYLNQGTTSTPSFAKACEETI